MRGVALSPRRSSMFCRTICPVLALSWSAQQTRGASACTDQQDVAIMQAESAEALFLAKPPFADIPEAPLRIRLVRESRSGLPAKFHGPARLSAGKDVG